MSGLAYLLARAWFCRVCGKQVTSREFPCSRTPRAHPRVFLDHMTQFHQQKLSTNPEGNNFRKASIFNHYFECRVEREDETFEVSIK